MIRNRKTTAGFIFVSVILIVMNVFPREAAATIVDHVFYSPEINDYYETSDYMTVDFTLDFTCPYNDPDRPIYIYIYGNWFDEDGNCCLDLVDVLEDSTPNGYLMIGDNYSSIGDGIWRTRITHTFRVPQSYYDPSHESECSIVVSFDRHLFYPPHYPDHFFGPCCFDVFFRHKDLPSEPIPVKDEGEIPILRYKSEVPNVNFLSPPFPNPFNPSTTIRFGLSDPSLVTLILYDACGRIVRTFYRNEQMGEGSYSVIWNGLNDRGFQVDSGVYFARFATGSITKTEKLILLH